MDSLPDLQWKNPDKGVCGYCDVQFSALLPKMQKRDQNQCNATENGNKQMSQT